MATLFNWLYGLWSQVFNARTGDYGSGIDPDG